jgi:hypothetical protein
MAGLSNPQQPNVASDFAMLAERCIRKPFMTSRASRKLAGDSADVPAGPRPRSPALRPRVAPLELLPSARLGMVGCASPLLSVTELERPQPPPSWGRFFWKLKNPI